MLKADVVYRGGAEGDSEYWWIRCHPDGKREQIHEPSKDHKQYKVSLEVSFSMKYSLFFFFLFNIVIEYRLYEL